MRNLLELIPAPSVLFSLCVMAGCGRDTISKTPAGEANQEEMGQYRAETWGSDLAVSRHMPTEEQLGAPDIEAPGIFRRQRGITRGKDSIAVVSVMEEGGNVSIGINRMSGRMGQKGRFQALPCQSYPVPKA